MDKDTTAPGHLESQEPGGDTHKADNSAANEKQDGEGKNEFVRKVAEQKYEFGFTTDVPTEIIDNGLNEDVVRLISKKKGELVVKDELYKAVWGQDMIADSAALWTAVSRLNKKIGRYARSFFIESTHKGYTLHIV